jgi:hypothetical protein
MIKHTPGPWSVKTDQNRRLSVSGPRYHVADICGSSATGDVRTRLMADANLISSAPDLLAACEAGLAILLAAEADVTRPCAAVVRMRAAIAKAKGESK